MTEPDDIMFALRDVYDPEIRTNIVDLGLIYDIRVEHDTAYIKMTLTSPNCPASPEIKNDVVRTALKEKGINDVKLDIVWEPAWTPDKMSEEARLELGYDI